MLSIHQRPFEPLDRSEPGHWEGDLIIGKNHGSAIGTHVERQTRMVRLLDSQRAMATACTTHCSIGSPIYPRACCGRSPGTRAPRCHGTRPSRRRSGSRSIPRLHSPWQRGSNENTNGLLRDYFPKGTDLSIHTPEHLRAVEDELNGRPRIVLADCSAAELFQSLLASPVPSVLRR